jgi:hypothetical protein
MKGMKKDQLSTFLPPALTRTSLLDKWKPYPPVKTKLKKEHLISALAKETIKKGNICL